MTSPLRAREADLDALLARLEKATGPDRELDGLIARDVGGLSFGFCGEDGWYCGDCEDSACGRPLGLQDERHSYPLDWRDDERLPPYTASIDAALALVELVLPGWDYILEHTNGGLTISCLLGTANPDKRVWGNTLPLAIIAALLRTQETQDDHKL